MKDSSSHAISLVAALCINVAIFTGMAMAGMIGGPDEIVQPEEALMALDFKPVELPKLGEERPKHLLKRIVKAPEPEPRKEDPAATLARQKEKLKKLKRAEQKKLDAKKKKKRQLDAAKKKKKDEEKKKKEKEKELKEKEDEKRRLKKEKIAKKKKRKKAMARALRRIPDERADEDSPDGFADGSKIGTSTDPNSRRNKAIYINRVEAAIRAEFSLPSVISKSQRRKLSADVHFKFGTDGKLKGNPRIARSSRNAQFDAAVLRALKHFKPGSRGRLPVPPATQGKLRRSVLKKGLTMKMKAS